jgi:hypothetical protein
MPLIADHPHRADPRPAEASLPPAHEPHSLYVRIFTVWEKINDRSYLSIKDFLTTEEEEHLPNYDRLVQLIDDAHYDRSEFGRWIFEQAASFLSEIPASASANENIQWSHAASHLLRGSAIHPTPHRSLLDDPPLHPSAKRLMERAVEFCELSGSLGTTAVTLNGVIASNLNEWAKTGDITAFYFRPEYLRSARFLELLKEASDHEARVTTSRLSNTTASSARATVEKFCRSDTPAEFLERALLSKRTIPLRHLAAPLETILRIHCSAVGAPVPLPYIPADLFASESLEPTKKFVPGVFIDIFGTLIQDGEPYQPLVEIMRELLRSPSSPPVFLISDSDQRDIDAALSTLPRPLPPVIPKSSLSYVQLEYLIDNDEPDPQGLSARYHVHPLDAVKQPWSMVIRSARNEKSAKD